MIERDDVDDIAVVRMAHGKVSAQDVELLAAIRDTFRDLATTSHRAVVLTGTGRSFSAGADLWRLVREGAPYARELVRLLGEAYSAVFDLEKPVVAAVNGHALAGGFVLMCACDERIAADVTASIGVTEVLVGVPFPSVPLEIVRYAAGDAATSLVLTGRSCAPRELLELKVVDEVVPTESLVARAVERARWFADSIPARTFAITKRQLHAETNRRIAAGTEAFGREVEETWTAPETIAWIERFMRDVTAAAQR